MPDADDGDDDPAIPVQDARVAAAQFRASGLFSRMQALKKWIGQDGSAVTQTGVFRPAVARDAIAALGLDDWMVTELQAPPQPWRSAGEHLGLDRLHLFAVEAEFLEIRGTGSWPLRSEPWTTRLGR